MKLLNGLLKIIPPKKLTSKALMEFKKILAILGSLMAMNTSLHSQTAESHGASNNNQFIQTVPSEVVEPSEKIILKPGQKVKVSNYDAVKKGYIIQRLAPNVYWVTGGLHRSTIIIGKKGVLVIDPLAYGNGKHLIDAVHHLTSLPITHLIYTHHHTDHIGDAKFFVEEAKKHGLNLVIVGNTNTSKEIKEDHDQVPLPTYTAKIPYDTYHFENELLEFYTYPPGHSEDNMAILLKNHKILHYVDTVHPNQLEFEGFATENYSHYKQNLKNMLALDWDYLNAGHANIGSKADVVFVLNTLDDIEKAILAAMPKFDFGHYITADKPIYSWFAGHENAVVSNVVEALGPKYGHVDDYDIVFPSQVTKVYWHILLNS